MEKERYIFSPKLFQSIYDNTLINGEDEGFWDKIEKDNSEKQGEITVYMGFSTDILHSGHIAIINKAAKIGKIIAGVLTDEAISDYKGFSNLSFEDRKAMLESLKEIDRVVPQKTLSY